jgi:hypothetical protein
MVASLSVCVGDTHWRTGLRLVRVAGVLVSVTAETGETYSDLTMAAADLMLRRKYLSIASAAGIMTVKHAAGRHSVMTSLP